MHGTMLLHNSGAFSSTLTQFENVPTMDRFMHESSADGRLTGLSPLDAPPGGNGTGSGGVLAHPLREGTTAEGALSALKLEGST